MESAPKCSDLYVEAEVPDEWKEFISTLPSHKGWKSTFVYKYQGFWYSPAQLLGTMGFQQHFQAVDSDLFLITTPKAGTVWLKALLYAIVNRTHYCYNHSNHPLLSSNPHDLVAFIEMQLYANSKIPDLSFLPTPRLFSAHVSYVSLPNSLKESSSRIVYLCRNPRDTFISFWHFMNKLRPKSLGGPIPVEEAFEMFCSGVSEFGPFWEHVLGYWNESKARPGKVIFLKYEDIKMDPVTEAKRLAELIGHPFSPQEEEEGVLEGILKLCSFEKLSNLDVNKTGISTITRDNTMFFRQGKVGDWSNYLTDEMVKRLDEITEQKFANSGLKFQVL